MYAVNVNNDKTVTVTVQQRIVEGYKLAGWFYVFVDRYLNNTDMLECKGVVSFILPVSQKEISENLKSTNDTYNGSAKFLLSATSKLTKEAGTVKAKFIFKKDGSVMLESDYIEIPIYTESEYHDDDSDGGDDGGDKGCDCDEKIAKAVAKAMPLIFTSVSEAVEKLNDGSVENIYYGRSVIIPTNEGKYLLYSVQGDGKGGYTVEPVDTYGETVEWEDLL